MKVMRLPDHLVELDGWASEASTAPPVERHAIIAGALTEGNLTIGGGSGSIICDPDNDGCGLHGWIRNGEWVRA